MLRGCAWAVAVAHLAAGVVGAFVIAPGTSAAEADPGVRMAHVASHAGAWFAAWFIPMAAALTMIALAATLKARLKERVASDALELALAFTIFGAAVEVTASCFAAVMLPALARTQDRALFQALELTVLIATSTVGNTGFTLGQLLLVRTLKQAGAPRVVVTLGALNVLAGAVFVAVGVAGVPVLVPMATGAVFVTLAAYAVVLARSAL